MKDRFELRITQDGSIEGIYQDGLAQLLDANEVRVCRASNVEWEESPDGIEKGWTVRSAKDPELAIRWRNVGLELDQHVVHSGILVFFNNREDALKQEVKFFWDLLGWEHKPCPTHSIVGCMTCRYGEPPECCPKDCQGIDLGDGNWSGCSCQSGKAITERYQPKGWKCDCPQHTGPNPCKEPSTNPTEATR